MKVTRIAWDPPAFSGVDFYRVSWFFGTFELGSMTTLETHADIQFVDPGAYRFEVRAVFEDASSQPAVLEWWFEEFDLDIHWSELGIIVAWPSMIGRKYTLERTLDPETGVWTEIGSYLGTGEVIEVGGGQENMAQFRVWSVPT